MLSLQQSVAQGPPESEGISSELQWISLSQHNGIKSRVMLDWTAQGLFQVGFEYLQNQEVAQCLPAACASLTILAVNYFPL